VTLTCQSSAGSTEKPRAWSKYAIDSSAYKKLHPGEDAAKPKDDTHKKEKKKKSKKSHGDPKVAELLEKVLYFCQNDPNYTFTS